VKKVDDKVEIFKALGDKSRLLILDMLSCGEMCACDIMEGLNLSQPTISHHMKILQHAGLVGGEKKGKWMVYSLKTDRIEELCTYIKYLTTFKEKCICETVNRRSCD